MANRFIDWLTGLTAKSTTIDGTEITHIGSSGLSQKALLSDVIRYGGGNSTRVTTIGNANIHQKSDGTMWLEVTGQTAGNARGAGAFDWQAVRTNAANVASGANSIAIGQNCRATGIGSMGLGTYAQGSADSAMAIGDNVFATSTYSLALGNNAASANRGQISFAVSGGAGVGCAQGNLQTFYTATTDASSTPLNINGASNRMVIPAMRACAITGLVTAMSDATDGYKVKAWEIKCVITRDNSNSTRIIGTPTITALGNDADAAGWAVVSITADDTNEALAINVTGEAATNIRWQASLFYGQVGH